MPGSSALTACTDAGLLEGVDVSTYDDSPDWQAVRDAGVVFGIARVSDGLHFPDATFDSNWSQMKSVGIIRGAYQFFEAAQDPHQQAAYLLEHIQDFGPGDLPPVIDVESLDGLDAGTATAAVQAWVADMTQALQRRPIIYTSARVWNEFDNPPLAADLWVANWEVTCPAIPTTWSSASWTFWQYSATGAVPGLTAEADDLDRFNGSLAELEAYANASLPFDAGTDAGAGGVFDAGDGGMLDAGADAGLAPGDAGSADAGESDAGGSIPLIIAPANGATVSGDIQVTIVAQGAATIELFLDDTLLATGTSSPFTTRWDTRQSTAGTHHLQAEVFSSSLVGSASAIVSAIVDNAGTVTCPGAASGDGGDCAPCPSGTFLNGGACLAEPATAPGGCASGSSGFLGLLAAIFLVGMRRLRRKHTLRGPRHAC